MALKQIELPRDVIARCKRFGRDCSAGYVNGDKPESSYYTTREIDKDPVAQANAKMAECAFAIAVGKTIHDLDWKLKPDDRYDIIVNGTKIDVKSTKLTASHRQLIWPWNKPLGKANLDCFALVKVRAPWAEIAGWTSKSWFLEHHIVADGVNAPIDAGDLFMDASELWSLETLLAGACSPIRTCNVIPWSIRHASGANDLIFAA